MRKDFDGAAWTSRNRDDFSRLIAEAKRRKSNPALAAEPEKSEVEPETPEGVDVNGGPDGSPDNAFLPPPSMRPTSPPPLFPLEDVDPARPYKNNPEAIASIREKVDAANAGVHLEPVMNAGFASSSLDGTVGTTKTHENDLSESHPSLLLPAASNPALLEKSHFGLSNGTTLHTHTEQGLRCDVSPRPVKVPMFTVPQQPFSDQDGAEGGTVEH